MNPIERKTILINTLFNEYGSLTLGREETAKTLNISTATLDRLKDNGLGPKWSKDERSKNGKVTYAIDHIAEYIIQQNSYISV